MTTTRRSSRRLPAVLLALALSSGACSGGDEPAESAARPSPTVSESSAPEDPEPLASRVTVRKVTGKLSGQRRRALTKAVGAVVDGWWEAAYLGGEYPRRDFADAYPGFTKGAEAIARRDRRLLTNLDVGSEVEQVTATRRRILVDALAVRGRPVGATARVFLDFRTKGEVRRRIEVRGRLLLTRSEGRWRVFGYDLTKGSAR